MTEALIMFAGGAFLTWLCKRAMARQIDREMRNERNELRNLRN